MSESKRKQFTGSFKAKIALEAIAGAKTVNEIAQAPVFVSQTGSGVGVGRVAQWFGRYGTGGSGLNGTILLGMH